MEPEAIMVETKFGSSPAFQGLIFQVNHAKKFRGLNLFFETRKMMLESLKVDDLTLPGCGVSIRLSFKKRSSMCVFWKFTFI